MTRDEIKNLITQEKERHVSEMSRLRRLDNRIRMQEKRDAAAYEAHLIADELALKEHEKHQEQEAIVERKVPASPF